MKTLNINGDIVSDELAWVYDWYEMPYFCPKMARDVLESLEAGGNTAGCNKQPWRRRLRGPGSVFYSI